MYIKINLFIKLLINYMFYNKLKKYIIICFHGVAENIDIVLHWIFL